MLVADQAREIYKIHFLTLHVHRHNLYKKNKFENVACAGNNTGSSKGDQFKYLVKIS